VHLHQSEPIVGEFLGSITCWRNVPLASATQALSCSSEKHGCGVRACWSCERGVMMPPSCPLDADDGAEWDAIWMPTRSDASPRSA